MGCQPSTNATDSSSLNRQPSKLVNNQPTLNPVLKLERIIAGSTLMISIGGASETFALHPRLRPLNSSNDTGAAGFPLSSISRTCIVTPPSFSVDACRIMAAKQLHLP